MPITVHDVLATLPTILARPHLVTMEAQAALCQLQAELCDTYAWSALAPRSAAAAAIAG